MASENCGDSGALTDLTRPRRLSASDSLGSLLKLQINGIEDRLVKQMHVCRRGESELADIRFSSMEAKLESLEQRVSELSGSCAGQSEELQLHTRRVDRLMESRAQQWRQHLESEVLRIDLAIDGRLQNALEQFQPLVSEAIFTHLQEHLTHLENKLAHLEVSFAADAGRLLPLEEKLDSRLTLMATDTEIVAGRLAGVEHNFKQVEARLAQLGEQYSAQHHEISRLGLQAFGVEDKTVEHLAAELQELRPKFAEHSGQIEELGASMVRLSNSAELLQKLESGVAEQGKRLHDCEPQIAMNRQHLQKLDSELSRLGLSMKPLQDSVGDIDHCKKSLSEFSGDLEEQAQAVSNSTERLVSLEADVAKLLSVCDSIGGQLASMQQDLVSSSCATAACKGVATEETYSDEEVSTPERVASREPRVVEFTPSRNDDEFHRRLCDIERDVERVVASVGCADDETAAAHNQQNQSAQLHVARLVAEALAEVGFEDIRTRQDELAQLLAVSSQRLADVVCKIAIEGSRLASAAVSVAEVDSDFEALSSKLFELEDHVGDIVREGDLRQVDNIRSLVMLEERIVSMEKEATSRVCNTEGADAEEVASARERFRRLEQKGIAKRKLECAMEAFRIAEAQRRRQDIEAALREMRVAIAHCEAFGVAPSDPELERARELVVTGGASRKPSKHQHRELFDRLNMLPQRSSEAETFIGGVQHFDLTCDSESYSASAEPSPDREDSLHLASDFSRGSSKDVHAFAEADSPPFTALHAQRRRSSNGTRRSSIETEAEYGLSDAQLQQVNGKQVATGSSEAARCGTVRQLWHEEASWSSTPASPALGGAMTESPLL